jgi:hypothetical protein
MECSKCGFMVPFGAECPRCAQLKANASVPTGPPRRNYAPVSPTRAPQYAQADACPPQNPALVLGVGGGAVVLVFALFLIFRLATGTIGGPKSPFGDDASLNMSSSGSFNMPATSSDSAPSVSSSGRSNWQSASPSGGDASPTAPGTTFANSGPASNSLVRKRPIHNDNNSNWAIVEDHAEKRATGWVIVGKIHNLTAKKFITVKIYYSFYDANGQTFLYKDPTSSNPISPTPSMSLNANADASFEMPVPMNNACENDNTGFMDNDGM